MHYRLLGRSGLRVSELSLGTMTFGEDWGWGASAEESRRMFEAYVEAGGNFIDTANRYTDGTSERLVGEFVRGDRERYVVATKYTLTMRPGDANASGNHRKNLVQSLEASLRRLGTDYVDLYWVHAWDAVTPIEEMMRALDDVVRAGKVLYLGISDAPAWVVSRANTLAALRGWTPFTAMQIEYSLIERTPERELLPMARADEMAVLDWSPLGSGVLTGKFLNRDDLPVDTRVKEGSGRLSPRNLRIAEQVVQVAEELGRSPAQVSLNWVRQQPGLHIPILGARTLTQLSDNLGCLEFQVPQEAMARLDEVSRVDLGFPHEMLNSEYIRKIVYSGFYERLQTRRD
jgi:aryl-alcohol dehydrogenase-like predicted oxidoreductase